MEFADKLAEFADKLSEESDKLLEENRKAAGELLDRLKGAFYPKIDNGCVNGLPVDNLPQKNW